MYPKYKCSISEDDDDDDDDQCRMMLMIQLNNIVLLIVSRGGLLFLSPLKGGDPCGSNFVKIYTSN